MEQKKFTEFVIPKIIDSFSQLKSQCITKPNNIIDIEYASNNNKILLITTTQDREITVGYSQDQALDCHVHMNMLGANAPEE